MLLAHPPSAHGFGRHMRSREIAGAPAGTIESSALRDGRWRSVRSSALATAVGHVALPKRYIEP